MKVARPVPLKDHVTHVFMLYQLYYDEFGVGRLKWTTGYTMMLMMDVVLHQWLVDELLGELLTLTSPRKREESSIQKKKSATKTKHHSNLTNFTYPQLEGVFRIPCMFGCFQRSQKKNWPPKQTGKLEKLGPLRYVGHAALFGFRDLSPQDDTDASFGASTLWWGCRPVIHCCAEAMWRD